MVWANDYPFSLMINNCKKKIMSKKKLVNRPAIHGQEPRFGHDLTIACVIAN